MHWSDIEPTQPRLAALARERLIDPGVVLVATIRRDADAVAASLGWAPAPGRFHLFAVDIDQVTFISYDTATGDQHVAMWPPGREFVRRATSATSVGDPEPVTVIIEDGLFGRTGRGFSSRSAWSGAAHGWSVGQALER